MNVTEAPPDKPDVLVRLTHEEAKALKWALQVVRFEHDIRSTLDQWTKNGKPKSRPVVIQLDDKLANMGITSVFV